MSKESDIYVQEQEPENVKEGDVWIITSTDDESQSLEIPPYGEADYGKVLSPSADGLVWIEMTGGGTAELPSAEEEAF